MFEKEEKHCYKGLIRYFHLLKEWEKQYAPQQEEEKWHPFFVEVLQRKSYIAYQLDILCYGSLEERKEMVAKQKNEVVKLEQRIAELSKHSGRSEKQPRADTERESS